jgi:uncharacterized protein with PIN domain
VKDINSREIKLLADAMLGRLAKYLRILGYDTVYMADTDDYAVMRVARAEDRLILTRDHGLARRRGVHALLIESEEIEEQLHQVHEALGPPPPPARCPVCNTPLQDAPPEVVVRRVPPYVQRTQEDFSLCPSCRRIFWRGTHWQNMQVLIGELHDEPGSDTIQDA